MEFHPYCWTIYLLDLKYNFTLIAGEFVFPWTIKTGPLIYRLSIVMYFLLGLCCCFVRAVLVSSCLDKLVIAPKAYGCHLKSPQLSLGLVSQHFILRLQNLLSTAVYLYLQMTNQQGLGYLTTQLYGMHQIVPIIYYFFWVKYHPNKVYSQKKSWQETKYRPPFPPTTKPHPLNPLYRGPTSLVLVGYRLVVLRPFCACSTVFYFLSSFVPTSFLSQQICFVLFYCLSLSYFFMSFLLCLSFSFDLVFLSFT